MAVSYKRLWKLLIDKDMKKKDLAEKANISSYTINKLNRGDNVNTDTVLKDFPLFCPKCKLTHIIDVEKLEIVIKNTEKQTFII